MEYSYTDIEAHIREAQKLRSEALAEMLSTGYTKSVRWLKGLLQHKLHQVALAARSFASPIY